MALYKLDPLQTSMCSSELRVKCKGSSSPIFSTELALTPQSLTLLLILSQANASYLFFSWILICIQFTVVVFNPLSFVAWLPFPLNPFFFFHNLHIGCHQKM